MNPAHIFITYGLPILGVTITVFAYKKIYYHFKLLQLTNEELENISYLEVFMDLKLLLKYFYIIFPFYFRTGKESEQDRSAIIGKVFRSVYGFWITFFITIIASIAL